MLEIAGIVVSGLGLMADLAGKIADWNRWEQGKDLLVDGDWVAVAIDKGILDGAVSDYSWSKADKVATRELKGTRSVFMAIDDKKKIKYRIVRKSGLVLMKKLKECA
ncbi:MAG: hypothetical protein IH924_05460 [Proteobacteria bacterium]|nr:hypothetical protein [Pseudomonadota bacterium]